MSVSVEHAIADALALLAQRPDALEVIQKIHAILPTETAKEDTPSRAAPAAREQLTNVDMANAHAVSAAAATRETQNVPHSAPEDAVYAVTETRREESTAIVDPLSATTTRTSRLEEAASARTLEIDAAPATAASCDDVACTSSSTTKVETSVGAACSSVETSTMCTTPKRELVPFVITAPQVIETPHVAPTNSHRDTTTVATSGNESAALPSTVKSAAIECASSSQEHLAVAKSTLTENTEASAASSSQEHVVVTKSTQAGTTRAIAASSTQEHIVVRKSTQAEHTIAPAASSTTPAPTTPRVQVKLETPERITPRNASLPDAPSISSQNSRPRIYGPTTTQAYLAANTSASASCDAVLAPMMSSAHVLCDQADHLIRALTSAKDALRAQLALFPAREVTLSVANTENAQKKATKEETAGQKGKTKGKGKGKKGEKRPLSACGTAIHRSKQSVSKRMRGLQNRCSRFLSVIGKEADEDSDSSSSSSDVVPTKDDKDVYLAKRRARFPNGAHKKKEKDDNDELEFDQ